MAALDIQRHEIVHELVEERAPVDDEKVGDLLGAFAQWAVRRMRVFL